VSAFIKVHLRPSEVSLCQPRQKIFTVAQSLCQKLLHSEMSFWQKIQNLLYFQWFCAGPKVGIAKAKQDSLETLTKLQTGKIL
jgi:hypothetical protein